MWCQTLGIRKRRRIGGTAGSVQHTPRFHRGPHPPATTARLDQQQISPHARARSIVRSETRTAPHLDASRHPQTQRWSLGTGCRCCDSYNLAGTPSRIRGRICKSCACSHRSSRWHSGTLDIALYFQKATLPPHRHRSLSRTILGSSGTQVAHGPLRSTLRRTLRRKDSWHRRQPLRTVGWQQRSWQWGTTPDLGRSPRLLEG
mmetsp:Transcript_52798/g.140366  ORF Transcript_52798/g.140366 Transcript_52798/m.140366 type:complete len:203 (+) Transcript_52798:206-814(+)